MKLKRSLIFRIQIILYFIFVELSLISSENENSKNLEKQFNDRVILVISRYLQKYKISSEFNLRF